MTSVALSTVTGTRTGAVTSGSTGTGSVGSGGQLGGRARCVGAVLVTAGVCAAASWGGGATQV